MAISGPSNLTCSKTVAQPGEQITLYWNAASGNFNRYALYMTRGGVKMSYGYVTGTDSYVNLNFPTDAVPGESITYSMRAEYVNVNTAAVLETGQSEPSCTVICAGAAASTGSGRLEQFQNSEGTNIYPKTVLEGVFRQSDGKSLEQVLSGMISCGTTDLTAGSSHLAAGTLYGVY